MPLHEYRCQKCGHQFEKISKFSDAPLKKCPECGGKVDQLLSAPAVHFKGSGFYITDYAKKSSSETSANDGGSATLKADEKKTSTDAPSDKPAAEKTASETKPAPEKKAGASAAESKSPGDKARQSGDRVSTTGSKKARRR